jgi:hypothetical protein
MGSTNVIRFAPCCKSPKANQLRFGLPLEHSKHCKATSSDASKILSILDSLAFSVMVNDGEFAFAEPRHRMP